ncbi:hypothetical protein GF382_00375 [Candidatus Falkowbacteria bacterium]|nr:hypothetical protein [Candidatus Falkowbacteria bacterium]
MKQTDISKQDIKGAIVEAIAFFDLFDRPLVLFDLWQSLKIKIPPGRLAEVLEEDDMPLEKSGPFYFLKGRRGISENIREQAFLSERKEKIARRLAKILRFVNGVRLVAVCNNFYYKKESDIDLFIIIKAGRMWLVRLAITAMAQIMGLRRHGDKIADRVCLSFYITDKDLDLSKIVLREGDPYFYQWFRNLKPIYDDGVYRELYRKNKFFKDNLPNAFIGLPIRSEIKDSFTSLLFKKLNGFWFNGLLGDALERAVKKIQLKKMSYNQETAKDEDDTRVMISDDILKFHENDRREEFRRRLKEKIFNF